MTPHDHRPGPLTEPETDPVPLSALEPALGAERVADLARLGVAVHRRLHGRTVVNVNSTATGGGVAEMLAVDLRYVRSAGVDARWLVIGGNPGFFTTTKRIHNKLHGSPGDGGPLGQHERDVYESTLAPSAAALDEQVSPGDVVILHDPQTAGLVERLAGKATVVWRCHVGRDTTNPCTDEAWAFLRPYLERAHGMVFSREQYVPDWVDRSRLAVIPPAIDPLAVKNRPLEPGRAIGILSAAGILAPSVGAATAEYEAPGCPLIRIRRTADVTRVGPPPPAEARLVVQVSRWDRLKDMPGVLRGFTDQVAGRPEFADAHLMLAGPSVAGVTDDPEGQQVFEECLHAWRELPPAARAQVSLVNLPMTDPRENALMVNALQQHAAIVVQKSLVEGFGLTAAEAMWKSRAVIVSAVGGLQDQVEDGRSGLLVDDPADLEAFGTALRRLLADPAQARRLGAGARERVRACFLPDRQLDQWGKLLLRLH